MTRSTVEPQQPHDDKTSEDRPRYSRFIEWACPGCGAVVRARGAIECLHECPRRNNRVTSFERVGASTVAS